MALNYPGPYQVRIFYTAQSRVHVHALNFQVDAITPQVGDLFSDIYPMDKGGASATTLDLIVDDYVALIDNIYNTGASIDFAECWAYEPESFEATFISSYTINAAGTNGAATEAASETIFTFRTQEGGSMRLSLLDTVVDPGVAQSYGDLAASYQAIVDFVLSSDNIWLARDTSYPTSFIKMYPGTNEALFKKIYR